MSPSTQIRRPENLALFYQDVLTVVVRLRANRQAVDEANAFRHHTREALKKAATQALAAGYTAEDVKQATFAAVAFLDESVLNCQDPLFADWLRKPMQEELFGTHVAGEVFFQNLQRILARSDAQDVADLLEVYYLCLLLGFGGRYSAGNRGELKQIMDAAAAKIHRIRGRFGRLSPEWALPDEKSPSRRDPWVRRLAVLATVCAVLMALLFIGYKVNLNSGAADVGSMAERMRSQG